MRNRRSPNQLMFEGFETEFEKWLEPGNRWILLSRIIPWEELSVACQIIKIQKPLLMTIRRSPWEAARPNPVMTPNRRPVIRSQ